MTTIIKHKTLFDLAQEKKCTTIGDLAKYIIGKQVKTIGVNRSGHNYPKTFKVKGINPNYYQYTTNSKNTNILFMINDSITWNNHVIYLNELCLDSISITDLENNRKSLLDQAAGIEQDITICKELGLTEYDERLIRTVKAIDTLKTNKSKDKTSIAKKFIKIIEGE